MKVKILKKLKEIDNLLFSDILFILGFLTNLGLVTASYILFLVITDLSFLENITKIWRVNIFTIIYLILHVMALKTLIGENKKLKIGLVVSNILILIVLIKYYITTLL